MQKVSERSSAGTKRVIRCDKTIRELIAYGVLEIKEIRVNGLVIKNKAYRI